MSERRILYITSRWPGVPVSGTQQRLSHIGRLLQRLGTVRLVVVGHSADAARWRARTEEQFDVASFIAVKPSRPAGAIGRLRHEFDPRYLQTAPMTVDALDRRVVIDLVHEHDVVWVHGIPTANVLDIYRWPRSVIDIDDIPSQVYRSTAGVGESLIRRLLNLRMSSIWRRREATLAERFAVVLVCSDDDRRYLGLPRVKVLPNGFERVAPIESEPATPPRIGYIGTLTYSLNVDGVQWFCRDVWPMIRRNLPDVRLRLIGEGSEMAREWGDGVEPLGRLDEVGPEMATWSATIIPVRAGAGTRIKLAEAFARRCPVVATALGAYGYDVHDGEEVFIADEPERFASRCLDLIRLPERARGMADRAHHRFLQSWTWESYATVVEDAVRAAVQSGGGPVLT